MTLFQKHCQLLKKKLKKTKERTMNKEIKHSLRKRRRLPYAELQLDLINYPISSNGKRGERLGGLSSSLIHYMLKQMGRGSTISVGRPKKITKNEIKEYIQKNPDALLKEMSVYFNCSITACWNALKRNNIEKKYKEI